MEKISTTELIIFIAGAALVFFVGRMIALWYYKIDDRITQQHETNRLLRKLAGEPYIESGYLTSDRSSNQPSVSSKDAATAPLSGSQTQTEDTRAAYHTGPELDANNPEHLQQIIKQAEG